MSFSHRARALKNPEKILIIKLFAIGELIMATPLIASVKRAFPHAQLHVLTGNSTRELIALDPHIDKIITVREDIFLERRVSSVLSLALALRREKYSLIFCLHRPFPLEVFTWLCGGKLSVGLARNRKSLLYDISVVTSEEKRHQIDEYLDLLRALDREPEVVQPGIVISPESRAREKDLLNALKLVPHQHRLIGFSPSGGNNPVDSKLNRISRSRKWPDESFGALARKLTDELEATVLLIGSKAEQASASVIMGLCGDNCHDLTGQTDLMCAVSLIADLDLLITTDSGPMHIANAVGTPILGIFGPTDVNVVGPRDSESLIVKSTLPCSPCFRKTRFPPLDRTCTAALCLTEITADQVFERVREFYDKGKRFHALTS